MAIKKSELYSSLWSSCDELRGSMDASQYKDYVLVLLFVKYISDRYANQPYAPIKIPKGSTFQDMVALKGNPNIGELINKKIIEPIAEANKLSEMPDFDNPDKLGSGAEMVKKLSNLISIFENPALDFRSNRADGDDILGDAYEYLMRHFATESGKSKGQFYTPAEVSRVMANIIGINAKNTTSETSVYDPTCGSGSLLLKVADEAEKLISVFGQENDSATAGLARMNMILHNNPTAVIKQGNTLSNPLFLDSNGRLKTFDFVVANPPFSFKSWSNGVNIPEELQDGGRFFGYGVPPAKNGDYAFLLHIVKSLKSKGKAAVILPHGVLFRGNAEAEIRKNLIRKGIIKGIIGLPANLFYGTGIPACLIIMDKENADNRKGIFMIDAGKGFVKDGNKNRLREQDIHKIVDVFNKQIEIAKFSRMVSTTEIEEKEFNLNIPRYIDSTEPEDIQNIEAHLKGDIPNQDIDALQNYWSVYPSLQKHLFEKSTRSNFSKLKIPKEDIKQAIFSHPEFVNYSNKVNEVFTSWKTKNTKSCKNINTETKPKKFIHSLSEDLLEAFSNLQLIDKYDVYQHLMTYWMETMQDDCYLIVSDGWKAGNEVEWTKKEFEGKLIPKQILIDRYFKADQNAIEQLEADRDAITAQLEELEEEHSGEDGYFADFDKVNKVNVQKRINELKPANKKSKKEPEPYSLAADSETAYGEIAVLEQYIKLSDDLSESNKKLKEARSELDKKLLEKYTALTESEIKVLVVDVKWIVTIENTVKNEMQRISQRLTQRIKELAERYETPLPDLLKEINQWEEKVNAHLAKMGFIWSS
jgi:type I restriction enzyme M protein